jgi:pimeloyl-ACP methyl ester carboxylesterase
LAGPDLRPHHARARHRAPSIRYDGRGTGLSDRNVGNVSFDGFVRDLEAVVDASGLKRFALLGMSQGSAISIAFAVRHPECLTHLVIYGGYARGRRKRAAPQDLEHVGAMVTLMRQGWGQDNPAFRQLWTSLFLPGGTPQQMQSFNEMQRISTSPANAVRMRQAMDAIDVADLLPHVRVPTLVIHCRGEAVAPFEEGRRLAAEIPGARFVALKGGSHCPLQSDPIWSRIFDEVNDFLRPRARGSSLHLVAKR